MNPIAIVCGAGIVSGKEVMCLHLAEGLRDQGHSVHLITSCWGSGEFLRRAENKRLATTRLWLGFISMTLRPDCIWMTFDQLRRWPQLLLGYRSFLQKVRPARIIHTNWQHALLLWPLLDPQRDAFWLHEVLPKTAHYQRLFHLLCRRFGFVVAVSHAVARSLGELGVGTDKVRVIWNGFGDPAGGAERIISGDTTIGIVGQIGPWKGHEDLLQAFGALAIAYPNARLEIYGAGQTEYESYLRGKAGELGLEGRITWKGFVDDQRRIYPNLCLLVVPSRSPDPLPTTAIEGAFFGVPTVASRLGGLPEIIEDGQTGYLFPAGNTAELSEKIGTLLCQPERRREMGKKARARALALFSQERFLEEFCTVLQNGF